LRAATLDRIERTERRYRVFLGAALVLETAFVVGFLLLADFGNRTHVLLLLSSVAVYMILGFGLFALGAHVSRCTLLVLKALALLEQPRASSEEPEG
jgi:hypothetical protein